MAAAERGLLTGLSGGGLAWPGLAVGWQGAGRRHVAEGLGHQGRCVWEEEESPDECLGGCQAGEITGR